MILVILDYGSGNLKSVYNSIWRAVKDNNLNHKIIVSNKVNDIKRGDYIILPGVGSYANCMTHLVDKPGLLEHLEDFVLYKKMHNTNTRPKMFVVLHSILNGNQCLGRGPNKLMRLIYGTH